MILWMVKKSCIWIIHDHTILRVLENYLGVTTSLETVYHDALIIFNLNA